MSTHEIITTIIDSLDLLLFAWSVMSDRRREPPAD
jgi:hypothetical protein